MNIQELDSNICELLSRIDVFEKSLLDIHNEYKYLFQFLKLFNIYIVQEWKNLNSIYKNIKKTQSVNNCLYKKIINDFQTLYKYYNSNIIESKIKQFDTIKNILSEHDFKLSNLQSEHNAIYYKSQLLLKKSSTLKINIIPDNINDLLKYIYNLKLDLSKIKNIIKKTKTKIMIMHYKL